MTPPNLMPVLPEIVLLCAACTILIVDLFLPPARRAVSYWLTQAALLVTAWIVLTTAHASAVKTFSNIVVDDMVADLLKLFALAAVSAGLFYGRRYLETREPVPRRDLRADAVRRARHDGADQGQPLPHALPRARAHVAVALRAGRAAARRRGAVGGGDEVLRPRGDGVGPVPVRSVNGLRRDRRPRHRPGDTRLGDGANRTLLTFGLVFVQPSAAKGTYLRSATISSTMGPGVGLDTSGYR